MMKREVVKMIRYRLFSGVSDTKLAECGSKWLKKPNNVFNTVFEYWHILLTMLAVRRMRQSSQSWWHLKFLGQKIELFFVCLHIWTLFLWLPIRIMILGFSIVVWTTGLRCSAMMWCQISCLLHSTSLAPPTRKKLATLLTTWVTSSKCPNNTSQLFNVHGKKCLRSYGLNVTTWGSIFTQSGLKRWIGSTQSSADTFICWTLLVARWWRDSVHISRWLEFRYTYL